MIKKKVYNNQELLLILIVFFLLKLNDVLYADGTWLYGSKYVFPLTAFTTIFTNYILMWSVLAATVSVLFIYSRIFSVLKILKNKKLSIFLFDADGSAGLGKFTDFIFSTITAVLIIISIVSFLNFWAVSLSMYIDPTDSVRYIILRIIIFGDLTALVVFIYPLKEIRTIIKRKKEEERTLLLERIKQKEKIYLERNLEINEFQEIEKNFIILKYIDNIPDWGIDMRHWLSLFGKVLLTFNGIALQILIKYLNA